MRRVPEARLEARLGSSHSEAFKVAPGDGVGGRGMVALGPSLHDLGGGSWCQLVES